jgi:thiol-disulfide isomerase/thioredoxin
MAAWIFAVLLLAQDVREQYYAAYRSATEALTRDPAASLELCRKGIEISPSSERYFWPIMIEANAQLGHWDEVRRLGANAVVEIEAGRLLVRMDEIADEVKLRKQYAEALDRSGDMAGARRQLAIAHGDPKEAAILAVERTHRLDRARKDLLATEFSEPLVPVRLRDLEGREVKLEASRGKIVIVAFWAEWCVPCLDELAVINSIYPRLRDRAEIVAINIDDATEKIKSFTKKNGYMLPMFTADARDHDAAETLQGESIPRLLIIDSAGNIRFQFQGQQDILPEKIEWIITRLAPAPN